MNILWSFILCIIRERVCVLLSRIITKMVVGEILLHCLASARHSEVHWQWVHLYYQTVFFSLSSKRICLDHYPNCFSGFLDWELSGFPTNRQSCPRVNYGQWILNLTVIPTSTIAGLWTECFSSVLSKKIGVPASLHTSLSPDQRFDGWKQ